MKNVLLATLLAFAASANALAQDVAAAAKFSVWLPSKSWALELQAPGFVAKANEMQADGRRYFRAENEKTHLVISVSYTYESEHVFSVSQESVTSMKQHRNIRSEGILRNETIMYRMTAMFGALLATCSSEGGIQIIAM